MKWWPHGLFGRLVIVLVLASLAAQLLTGTIWYNVRRSQLFEIPTRLLVSRLADTIHLLQDMPASRRDETVRALNGPTYQIHWGPQQPQLTPAPAASIVRLMQVELRRQLGHPVAMQVLQAELRNDQGGHAGLYDLLFARHPVGRYRLQVQWPDGRWLQVDATTGQAGLPLSRREVVGDYLLRIYLLRILVIMAMVLLVVRWLLKPLQRLAQAAEALGRNLHAPPMAVTGPVEVRHAALAFNLMQQRLRLTLRERGKVLAAVSHDLRSPITRLRLRAELLDEEAVRAAFRQELDHMEAAVTATLELNHDLWQEEHRQLMDIDALLQGLRSDYAESGISLTIVGSSRPYAGYPRSLRRALDNLLDNAVRYAGGDIVIAVDDGPFVLRLAVLDRGPGVAWSHHPESSDRAGSGTGGSGLGLSIVALIAEGHGGTLQLLPRADGGLAASLCLPRDAWAGGESAAT